MTFVLTLDIGGTNPRLALMKIVNKGEFELVHQDKVDKSLPSIIPAINDFLRDCGHKGYTTNICIAAVAGPVDIEANACFDPTNSKFPVIGNEIKEQTTLEHVLVINDFQAIGDAIVTLDIHKKNKSIIQITHFDLKKHFLGNRGVIGPGTGLGVSYLIDTKDGFLVSASEGGNAGVPVQKGFDELYNFIRNKHDTTHIGMESIVSGQGIRHIADFLLSEPDEFQNILNVFPQYKDALLENDSFSDDELKELILKEDAGELIDVAQVVADNVNTNSKARITMKIFMKFLGHASQAVAMHGLTTGGLFLTGGILPKNHHLFHDGDFMSSFTDNWKRDLKELLEKIPIFLIDDYDISFYGCARVAQRILNI